MITSILNLACPKGHRHYSPTPDAFEGRECYTTVTKSDGVSTAMCKETLHKIHGKAA